MEKTSGVTCCFCNTSAQPTSVDHCDISIVTNWERPNQKRRAQVFWCHEQCVKNHMHKKLKIHFWFNVLSSDLEEDDDE